MFRLGLALAVMAVMSFGTTVVAVSQFGLLTLETGAVALSWLVLVSAYLVLGKRTAADPENRRR